MALRFALQTIVLLILVINIRAASPFTDQFVIDKLYTGDLPGSSSDAVIVNGDTQFCFAYRTNTTALIFGRGRVDNAINTAIQTVSVEPESRFAVSTLSSNCILFYTRKDDRASSFNVYSLEDGASSSSIDPFIVSVDALFTLSAIADPDSTTFILGFSYYSADAVQVSFSMLRYDTSQSDGQKVVDGKFISTVNMVASYNAVLGVNLLQYAPYNASAVLLLNQTRVWTGDLWLNYGQTVFPSDSLSVSGATAITSQTVTVDSGLLCYSASDKVICNPWAPNTAQINRTSVATSIGLGSVPTLALLNTNATVLIGTDGNSLFATQFKDGRKVSTNTISTGAGSMVSFAAANAYAYKLTLLVRDSNGTMSLMQIRHDYCGDGNQNQAEECDAGPTGGPDCTADCQRISPLGQIEPPLSQSPATNVPFVAGSPSTSPSGLPQDNTQQPKSEDSQVGVIVPAVVIPVVVVAAGLIVLLVLLRRRKKRKGSLLHGKSRVEIAMDSIDDRLKIPYKSLVFKKEIGAGSYGKVYVGEWKGTPVAIKVSSSVTDMDGFFDEARITVGLQQHPNVVQTFGVSLDGQLPCIVLEFCEGGSLDNRLFDSDVTMTQQQKIALIKGIARGLYHLHTNNIVHRDLAARNVLLNKSGTPKISDFGMSRVLKSEAEKGKTKTNYGPIRWMAPESLRDLQYSTKSDVWSFGIVLYEVVSRNEPHIDVDPLEVAVKIKNESYHPSIPQNVEPVLREIMLSCWQPDPNNRPSMEQICNKLNTSFPDD